MVKNLVIAALSIALLASIVVHFVGRDPSPPTFAEAPAPTEVAIAEPPAPPDPQPEPPGPEATVAAPPEPLAETHPLLAALEAALDEGESLPGMRGAVLGFCLVGPDGETLYERRGDLAQIPASSLKTLTTATALEILGPDFHFETRLGISAPAEGAVKKEADLILLGGGDPTLSYADLEAWAKGLAEAGVTTIPGRVLGDGRLFPGSPFADFWNWGDIGNGYGSAVSGLNLEHNRFTAVFAPGAAEGDPAEFLGALPEIPDVLFWNETVTAAEGSGDGIVIHGGERAAVMHLRGTVPLGGEFTVRGAVPDPERFGAHHLRLSLLAAGIVVTGEAHGAGELFLKGEAMPEIAQELHVHESPPLLELVSSIHATSDNHETECVYQMLGIVAGMPPADVVRRHWEQRGLDLAGLRLVDGSGLARADHITPTALARLQQLAANGPAGAEYVGSLLDTAEGRIRFKAGAMSAVRSYAGLVETEEGLLGFALMMNHYASGRDANEIQARVFGALLTEAEGDARSEE